MAGRVNTKFVLVLSAVLVALVGGVLVVTWYIKSHNAPDLVRAGDAKMTLAAARLAEGDAKGASVEQESAEKLYSKAVFKESTNVEYLTKWRDCLRAWTPLTQTNYIDKFTSIYPACHRQLALVKASDIQAHRDYLDLLPSASSPDFNRQGAEFTINEVERTLGLLRAAGAESGPGQVLRRYRGLMLVRMMSEHANVTSDQVTLAREDLEAARAVDPSDDALVIGLYTWYAVQADDARRAGKTQTAEELVAKAAETLDGALAARPGDPELLAIRLLLDLGAAQRKEAEKATGNALVQRMREVVPTFKPRLDALEAAFRQAGPASITVARVGRMQDVENYIDGGARSSRTIGLMRTGLESRPDDFELMLALAQALADRNELDESISILQKVVDLPQKPLSADGARLFGARAQAVYGQANNSLMIWEGTPSTDPKASAAALDQARQYRAKLGQIIGTSDSVLPLYLDAMLKYAERDWPAAKRLLVEYNSRTGRRNLKAMWTLANVEMSLNNPGAAEQIMREIEAARPDLASVQIMLAQFDSQFKRNETAIRRLEELLRYEPDNKAAKDALERIKIAAGESKPTDPVAAVIVEGQRMLDGTEDKAPDVAGTLKLLEDSIKSLGPDPRLWTAVVMLKAQSNDREGALAAAKAGLAANPDSKTLKSAVDELSLSDPLEWRLKLIDASDAPELAKELDRHRFYLAAGKNDLAAAALERAAKIDPKDKRVVDATFLTAIRARDFAGAAKQVDIAVEKNLDSNGGATYKGRLLAAQGLNAEAAAVLKEVADRKNLDVESLRLLARMYVLLGRPDDADNAYKEALRNRPNDIPTLVDYISALSQRGDLPGALAVARENERVASTNPVFMNLLLDLEAAVGLRVGYIDPKDPDKKRVIKGALERREDMYARNPGNFDNATALATLYMDVKRWADSRRVIDALRASGDSLEVAGLEARLHAAQGDFDKARAAMDDFITRQGAAVTAQPFIYFGQLLAELRRPDDALVMLDRGRAFQDKGDPAVAKVRPVDRVIGDMLVNLGRREQAADVYKSIVDGGADGPRQEVRTRLVELLVTLQRYAEAAAQIEQIKSVLNSDVSMALLRADIAAGLGDEKKARQLYDSAVANFGSEPMVYFRRATWFFSKGLSGAPDALADLEAALRVRPTFWQARRFRAHIFVQQDRPDDAIRELREALKANPNLDELRLGLMNELVTRGKTGDAVEIGEEAVRLRPNDLDLFLSCASIFSQRQDWARAERFISSAWNLDPNRSDVAQAYLDTLLNNDPPNLNTAGAVLAKLGNARIDAEAGLLVARAKLIARRRTLRDAVPDLLASMNVVPLDPDIAVLAWFADVRRLVPKPVDAVALMERPEIPPRFKDWAAFLKASVLNETPDKRTQALAFLEEFLANAGPGTPYRLAYRLQGNIFYFDGRYAESAKAWAAGLEKFPQDWELLNNLAYTQAKFLGQFEQALPYAERAVQSAPQNAEAIDTLGYVQLRLKRHDEAEKTFKMAFGVARTVSTRVQIQLHLARLYLEQGKKELAKPLLDSSDTTIKNNPTAVDPSHKAELDELRTKADSP